MQLNWKQNIGAVIGNAVEFYDIAVFAALSVYISYIFHSNGIANSTTVVWLIFALRFLLRPLGGYVIGCYASKKGEKSALILTSLLTGFATLAMALAPVNLLGQHVAVFFLLFQIIQAFSFGGEYPILIQYLLKGSTPQTVSRVSSLVVGSSIVGVIFSLILVFFLKSILVDEQMKSWGWRIPLMVGVVNLSISYWLRLYLPDIALKIKNPSEHSLSLIMRVFMIAIVGSVIFYVQNIASGILGRKLEITNFSLLNSILLLACILLFGYLTDKISTADKAFKLGISALFVLAPVLYGILGSSNTILITVGTISLSIITALILGNLAAMLWKISDDNGIALGLGYNIAISIFGGVTPLIITQLIILKYGFILSGIYLSLSALPAAYILLTEPKHQ